MNKITVLSLLILTLLAGQAFPQFTDMKEVETGLVDVFNKIDYWHNYEINKDIIDKWDSLAMINSVLTQKLYDVLKSNRNSVYYDFPGLKAAGMQIVSNKDNSFRIFSWNTQTGGTMKMFNSILQYSYENKVSAKILNNVLENNTFGSGFLFTEVFTVKPNVYLVVEDAVYSTKDIYTGVRGFSTENGMLNDTIGIFKTKQGLVNEAGAGYDFFSVVELPYEQRPRISYDEERKTVSIPMTDFENDLTDKYLKFIYNGSYFTKEGPGSR